MKPKFNFKGGVWRCALWTGDRWIAGFGYTVIEAWDDYVDDFARLSR